MKKIVLILAMLFFSLSAIYSQNLSKMIITPCEDVIPTNICNDGNLGIIVFYSAIKKLEFKAVYPENAIKNSEYSEFYKAHILCIEPQETSKFSIRIIGEGFQTETYVVGSLKSKEKKNFIINAEDNTVEVTVLDKDNKPLDNYRVEIKGTGIVERGNNKGICKVELPGSDAATIIIFHRNYYDTIVKIVNPGDKIIEKMYNGPISSSSVITDAERWIKEGDEYLKKCNCSEALKYYNEALNLLPQNATYRRKVEETKNLAKQQEYMDKAKGYYKKAEAIAKPKWTANKPTMQSYINNYKLAVDEVEKAEALGSLPRCMQNDADTYREAYRKAKKIVNGKRALSAIVTVTVVGGVIIYAVMSKSKSK